MPDAAHMCVCCIAGNGDADSIPEHGFTSYFQGSMNVHHGSLLFMPQ